MNKQEDPRDMLLSLDGRPPIRYALPLGLQHVLAMFASNLAPVLLIASIIGVSSEVTTKMIQAAMLASGVTTLVQLYPIPFFGKMRIGARLPIVMGTSFSFVPVLISIANANMATSSSTEVLAILLGAAFFGGLVEVFLAFFMKYIKILFPPALIGTVILVIGFKLISVGVQYYGGSTNVESENFASPTNLLLATVVFFTIIIIQAFGSGLMKAASLLIGMMVGYLLAISMGIVDFTPVANAGFVSIPVLGIMPKFNLQAFISIAFLYIVTTVETVGHVSGITVGALNRDAELEETRGAIFADGFGSMLAALFGSFPNTSFGQNVGIVSLTKVVNRFAIFTGSCVLIAAAFIPKIGAFFNSMPMPVLGGAILGVFSMITITGLKVIAKAGFSENNILIISTALSLGYGFSILPQMYTKLPSFLIPIFSDSAAAVCFVGVVVHLLIMLRDNVLFKGKYAANDIEKTSNSGGF